MGVWLCCSALMNELKALMSCVCVSGTPRSEVQEEVECAPSPHLSLTLKVRPPQPGENNSVQLAKFGHCRCHHSSTFSPDVAMIKCVVVAGGRAGNEPGGGASSVQLQVHHLLLRPAAAAALLQRRREDG